MKIKQKILYGFLSVSLMTLAISYIVGISVQDDLINMFNDVAGESLPGNVAMARMTAEMYHVLDLTESYAIHKGANDKQAIENSLANLNTYMTMHFTYHLKENANHKNINNHIHRFTSYITEYLLLSQGNTDPAELHKIRLKIKQVIEGFRATIDEHIEEENWTSYLKLQEAKRTAAQARQILFVSSFVIIIIALGLSLFISGVISRPIIMLSEAARQIGKGRLDIELNSTSRDEIGQLAAAFNDMVMNISAMHEELVVTNENLMEEIDQREIVQGELDKEKHNLESVMESLPGIFYQIDTSGKMIRWNKTVQTVTGYSPEEIKIMRMIEFFADEDKTLVAEAFQKILSDGYAEDEVRIITKDRKEIPYLFSGSLKTIDDQKYIVGMAQDITEMKLAEAQINRALREKQVLLSEIHHRVKNNMTIINSLLSLQSHHVGKKSIEDVFIDSQNRIRAMAMVHEMLYQSEDLSDSNVEDYIIRLTNHLTRSLSNIAKPVRPIIKVTDITLGLDTMIPCGLILNELVTNSMKHAFSTTERPELHIALTQKDNFIHLEYLDNGPGLPKDIDTTQAKTFGLKIIKLLSDQVEGKDTFTYTTDGGFAFSLTFPCCNKISKSEYATESPSNL